MKNRKLRLESLEDRCLLAVTAGAPIAYSALTGVALQKDFGPVDIDNIEANPASLGSCPCEETTTQLPAPEILTGSNGHYASYGLNRHLIQWGAVENSSGYKLEYTTDGANWTAITTTETSVIVSHLPYGANVTYRVKVRGTGSYTCSEWSGIKTFNVCPMDINGDGDISGADRTLLANAWLAEEGDERYQHYCDINGDGDISNADRAFLSNNWLAEVAEETLNYPATDELPDITDVMLVGWTGYENGQPHSITVNDPHAATDTILYSADGETYDLTKNPSFTEAGSYTVYVKVSRARYNDFTGNATVVINSVPVGDITYTLEANGQPSVNTVGKTQQDAIQTDEIGIEFAAAPVVELTLSDIELVSGGSYITLDSLTKV
ncbi:MAG: hypothetical protein IJG60_03065, partial [Thermoguttaceae bacterium]|nr:hypothetical protein [Thermoguttaceae bacterium]